MNLGLGLDFGTSRVAAVLVDLATREVVEALAVPVQPFVGEHADRAEQDVVDTMAALQAVVEGLSASHRAAVRCLGVTGEMRGVVLWRQATGECSRVITAHDRRADTGGFLTRLQEQCADHRLSSGRGCVSLAWLANFAPKHLAAYDRAGTLMDLVVARLAGLDHPVMDPTNAHSWGMFDPGRCRWEEPKTTAARVPAGLLPAIAPGGSLAGRLLGLHAAALGLPPDLPVGVALGDSPAMLFATLTDPQQELAITLGHGGQLAAVLPPGDTIPMPPGVEYRPYVDGRIVAVVNTQLGGDILTWLARQASDWCRELGVVPPAAADVAERLNDLGLRRRNTRLRLATGEPGEGTALGGQAAFAHLGRDNFDLGSLAAACARGVVTTLRDRLPLAFREGRARVMGSGAALRNSRLLQQTVADVFQLELVVGGLVEEAAAGAALLVAQRCLEGHLLLAPPAPVALQRTA